MRQPVVADAPAKTARHGIGEIEIATLSEAELRDLYMEIFGEPTDEEIAAAIRRADAEYQAGDYRPPGEDCFDDDEPYRQPTKREILDGIAEGYKQALAGDVRPIEELLAELEADDS